MKARIKNGVLLFEQGGFSGGRKSVKGDGFVRIEFYFDKDEKDIVASVFDKLNTEDGHYDPLYLDKKKSRLLRDWLNNHIDKMD